jgi:predicted metal-dependent hydrolase
MKPKSRSSGPRTLCGRRRRNRRFRPPAGYTPEQIDGVVTTKRLWIFRKLAESPQPTDAFWNEVDKVLPDWRERKEWLRRRGAGLDL